MVGGSKVSTPSVQQWKLRRARFWLATMQTKFWARIPFIKTPVELDLVLSVFKLDLAPGLHDIHDRRSRKDLNYVLRKWPGVAPQYLDQPPGGVLHIAMRPVAYTGELLISP
jgi:hypothetical protein